MIKFVWYAMKYVWVNHDRLPPLLGLDIALAIQAGVTHASSDEWPYDWRNSKPTPLEWQMAKAVSDRLIRMAWRQDFDARWDPDGEPAGAVNSSDVELLDRLPSTRAHDPGFTQKVLDKVAAHDAAWPRPRSAADDRN